MNLKIDRSFLISVLLVLIFQITLFSQSVPKISESQNQMWKGFERTSFQFDGKLAFITKPKVALEGNPWVWNARFPGWHTDMDSILLSKGFYIAHINTANLFGSPKAIKIWDSFYNFLVEEKNLNAKVSLEGVSRGGLFVYNWAKENPKKINCIFAESPVCDFKSWPAGFGNGEGSPNDWKTLKQVYGFTSDEEAKKYMNNPIDGLEVLAKEKIPILHMISLKDGVVPADENTLVLVNRYIKLGGSATVVPCTEGEQTLNGHHFPVETPALAADFIMYNSQLPKQKLEASKYHKMGEGLKNSLIQFEKNKTGRVAFLGGSITYNPGWRDSISNYLQKRFPDTKFEFIAAGIPSTGTTPAAFRMERDLFSKGKIDLLFEEAAVNDSSNGRTDEEQTLAMEGIIRHALKSNPEMAIVMMHFVDPDKIKTYRLGKVPDVIKNHNLVADYYHISTINLAKEVTDRIDNGEFTWVDDFKNLHPSPFGQGVYANSMIQFLDNAYSGHLDNDDKLTAIKIPKKLNANCYDKGVLIPISKAKIGKGWSIDSSWNPKDGIGTRANYVNVPMLISNQPGSKLKFGFEGNAVGIAVAAGKDAGMISYRIDKGEWKKLNLFTRWSSHLHLPWYYTLATGLSEKEHTLEIQIIDEKDEQSVGNACRIRYFYVNRF